MENGRSDRVLYEEMSYEKICRNSRPLFNISIHLSVTTLTWRHPYLLGVNHCALSYLTKIVESLITHFSPKPGLVHQ